MEGRNPGINYGIIGGIGASVIALVLYLIDVKWYITAGSWLAYILIILLMVMAVKAERDRIGPLSWNTAFMAAFITGVIACLIAIIFSWLMYNVIDPELPEIIRDQTIAQMERMEGMLGEEGIERAIDQIDDQDFGMNFTNAATGFGINVVVSAIIAAIIALIMKSRDPNI